MPAGPFSTPLSGLALEMAVRNQQQLNQLPATTVAQRAAINKRLTPYGGDLAQYEPAMQAGYEPAVNTLRSTLEAQRDYLVGLPELLLAAQKEGVGTGASATTATPDTSGYMAYWNDLVNKLFGKQQYTPSTAYRPSPDVLDRPAYKTQTGPAVKARRLSTMPVRKT